MNKISKFLVVSAVTFTMLGLTSCTKPPFMAGGVPVDSQILSTAQVSQSGVYQATLISRNSVQLQPQVSGQISQIFVKAGDRVKQGQMLMVIDKRKQEATLNSSRADLEVAKAGLNSYVIKQKALTSSLEFNKKLYERYKALYEKKSVSQQDLEKYTDAYNQALADLDANKAQIEAQKAGIARAVSEIKAQEVQLQYFKISAPYSGIIGDIPVKIGNQVTETTVLLSITQNNPLEINVGLPVEKLFDIQKGLLTEVLGNDNNVIGKSTISFISPKVDTDTQTVLVKAILPNPNETFKADQSVKVRVIFNKTKGILVPTSAISHFGGQDFAFLINKKDGKYFVKQIPVILGDIQDNKYVVINGIKEGDNIVTAGLQKLMDGAPVTLLSELQNKGAK